MKTRTFKHLTITLSILSAFTLLSACSSGSCANGTANGNYNLVIDSTSSVPIISGNTQNFYVYVKNVGNAPANNLTWNLGDITPQTQQATTSWWSKLKTKLGLNNKLQNNIDTIKIIDAADCNNIAAGASCRILLSASNPASIVLSSHIANNSNTITQSVLSAYPYTPSYNTAADTLTLSPLSPVSYASGYAGYSFFIINNSNNSISLESAPFGSLPAGMNYSLLAGQSCANPMPAHTACQVRMVIDTTVNNNITSAVNLTPTGSVVGGESLPTQGTVTLTTTSQKVGIPNTTAIPTFAIRSDATSKITKTAYISNTGDANLIIGNLSSSNPLISLASDECSNKTLKPSEVCSYQISADPTAITAAGSANIEIPYNNSLNSNSALVAVAWTYTTIIPSNPAITISNSGNLNQINLTSTITIQNTGNVTLNNLGTPVLTTNSSHLTMTNGNCSNKLDVNQSCYYTLTYAPAAPSETTTATISGISASYLDTSENIQSITLPANTTVNVNSVFAGLLSLDGSISLDGTNYSKTITITNIGTDKATISNIAVNGSNLSVNPSSCANKELAESETCNVIVSLTDHITAGSGNGSLNITYDNHNGNTTASATSNISWLIGEAASLNVTFSQSNLVTLIGAESSATVTLTNNGNTGLNGITLPTLSAPLSWAAGTTDSCALNNTQNLARNASCNLTLVYAPTVSNTAGTVVTLGKFNATTAQSAAYSTSDYTVTVTAIRQSALTFDNGSTTSVTQSANWTSQSPSTTVVVKNINPSSITIDSTPITGVNATATGCSGTLSSGATCSLTIIGNTYTSSGSGTITVNYTDTQGSTSQSLPITVNYQAQPIVSPNFTIAQNPSGQITLLNNSSVVPVTLTLTNNSTVLNAINATTDGTLKIKASSLVPTNASGVSYSGLTGSCVVDGNGYISLSNQNGSNSCTYTINVTSSAPHGTVATGNATSQYQYQTYTNPSTVNYGTDMNSVAILINSITQSATGLLTAPALANQGQINDFTGVEAGVSSPLVSFSVQNVGATAISSITAPTISGFTFNMSSCNNLAAGASCTFTAVLNSTTAISGNLNAYVLSYGSNQASLPNMPYSVVLPNSPVITANIVVNNCQQGTGLNSNTCKINTGNSAPAVVITFTNTGAGSATNFSANTTALVNALGSSGYSTTLGLASCSNATLTTGNACTITISPTNPTTSVDSNTAYDIATTLVSYSYNYGTNNQFSGNGSTSVAVDTTIASPTLTIANIADITTNGSESTTITLSNWFSGLPAVPTYSFSGSPTGVSVSNSCTNWTAALDGGTCNITIAASNSAAAGSVTLTASIASIPLSSDKNFTIVAGSTIGNYIFTSSTTTTGNIKGSHSSAAEGADAICNSDSNRPSSRPNAIYKALLVTSTRNNDGTGRNDWPLQANTSYYNIAGNVSFTTDANALPPNNLTNAITPGASAQAWTGAGVQDNGTVNWGYTTANNYCNDWTSDDASGFDKAVIGANGQTDQTAWNYNGGDYCQNTATNLYCVQQ